MALNRKSAAPQAPKTGGMMDLGFYSGGQMLPEGDYALEFNVVMHQGTKADGTPAGPARLGVMVTAHPLSGGEPHNQFLSMGSKAHESFAPDPETGKDIVPVPGGPGVQPNNKTNWVYFLKSLYDCGMPDGLGLADIDGVHVHTQNVPEPEDRKGFGAKTGEAQEERRQGLMPVVTEIKEDGKPWEGSGGIPAAEAPKKGAKAPVQTKAPAKAAPKKAAPEPAADDEDLESVAVNGVSSVLENNPKGVTKLLLRTGTFKAVSEASGADAAQQVISTFFGSDDALNGLINQLGFSVAGAMVKPV